MSAIGVAGVSAAAGGVGGSRHAAGSGGAGQQSQGDDDAGMASECTTRITYGSAWIRPPSHTASWDDVSGSVTWDGSCQVDASGNSFATLSNGWRPFFTGRNTCVIAVDVRGSCAPKTPCSTRISYGADWLHPDGHADSFDDVDGAVTTTGDCVSDVDSAYYLTLSNGWKPHFKGSMGKGSCEMCFRYSQCGGLFANPVVNMDCPDPGVLKDGDRYLMACTSDRPEFPMQVSSDLVHWKKEGSVFTDGAPRWADSQFWAPELFRVGDHYLAYFSAHHRDGDLAIGVATASVAQGPYQDMGEPLLRDSKGVIEPHMFAADGGTRYLLWKANSTNAEPTEIRMQPLTVDGLALALTPATLLTSSEPWEGGQIHAPWLSFVDGYYYLFYTGETGDKSAIGVARASALAGPYMKAAAPLVSAAGDWVGPTTGSLVRSPAGNWVLLFHASTKGHVGNNPPGRQVLLARVQWVDGWPSMLGAPSSLSQPLP